MNEVVNRLIENRLNDLERHAVRLSIDLEHLCRRLVLSSKKVIALRQLVVLNAKGEEVLGNRTGTLHRTDSGALTAENEFLAKWHKDNDYRYEVVFDEPISLSKIIIEGETRVPSTDWIFHSTVELFSDHDSSNTVFSGNPAHIEYEASRAELTPALTAGEVTEAEIKILLNVLYRKDAVDTFKALQMLENSFISYDLLSRISSPTVL